MQKSSATSVHERCSVMLILSALLLGSVYARSQNVYFTRCANAAVTVRSHNARSCRSNTYIGRHPARVAVRFATFPVRHLYVSLAYHLRRFATRTVRSANWTFRQLDLSHLWTFRYQDVSLPPWTFRHLS